MTSDSRTPPEGNRTNSLSPDTIPVDDSRAEKVTLRQPPAEHRRDGVREPREQAWLEENRAGIRRYNERIACHGSFGDRFRRF